MKLSQSWLLEWSHGRAWIHAFGGMIGETQFWIGDRWLSPLHEAPWVSRGGGHAAGVEANLRGEWMCLPFGRLYDAAYLPKEWGDAARVPVSPADAPLVASDAVLHGPGANAQWDLIAQHDSELSIAVEYPADSPIARVARRIRPVPGEAAITVSTEVTARRACRRPFGFHPNFALPGPGGSFRIEPGRFRLGLTHPTGEPGVSRANPNSVFESLDAVPLRDGGHGAFDRLPFAEDTEEIVQLCDIDGHIRLTDASQGVAWALDWAADDLPSCLLWMSNRGRKKAPWNGRNLCLGIEPVATAFDLGSAVALAGNPIAARGIATALAFRPDQPRVLESRISGSALP